MAAWDTGWSEAGGTSAGAIACVGAVSFAAPSRSFSSSDDLTSDDKKMLVRGELVGAHYGRSEAFAMDLEVACP